MASLKRLAMIITFIALGAGIQGRLAADTPEPLSLPQALEELHQHNEDLAALTYRIRAAQEEARAVMARRRGQLAVTSEVRQDNVPQPLIPLVNPLDRPSFGQSISWQGFQASLPLDIRGRLRAEGRQAELQGESFEARKERALHQLAFELQRSFYAILGGREALQSLRFSRTTLKRHHERILRLQREGRNVPIDAMRIAARTASLDAEILSTQNDLASHRRVIANLLAREGSFRIAGELTVPQLPPGNVEAMLEEALSNRPDVRARMKILSASRQSLHAARESRKGQLALRASWGRRQIVDHGWDAEEGKVVGTLTLSLDWPLFDGGARAARQRQARARMAAEEAELASLRRRVRHEVEQALDDLASALARLAAQERSAKVAHEALRKESLSYEEGRSTLTDVLDSERSLSTARSEETRARVDAVVARARIDLVLGREIDHD